jgi:hypothetical protein
VAARQVIAKNKHRKEQDALCNHLTLLAEYSERHYIMQCEHGTIHLVWGNQTLRFHARDLRCLVELFRQWTARPAAPGMQAGGLRIFHTAGGCVQCWIADAGLRLLPSEIDLFESLLRAAGHKLAAAHTTLARQTVAPFGDDYRPLAPLPIAAISAN